MRLRSLDSLRGVAALAVVAHHCVLSFPGALENREVLAARGFSAPWAWLYLTPLRLFVAGPVAVYVFFVLSGLVLALTFVERDGDRYLPYLIKRVSRIWLPFAVAIVLSVVDLRLVWRGWLPTASDWFNFTWSQWPSARTVASHLLMTGGKISLDNPMWSLVHEMRISLIFPLLVFLCRKSWLATLAASVVIGAAASRTMEAHPSFVTSASWIQTCTYLFMFVLGIGLAMHSRALRHRLERLGPRSRAALWCLAIAGLAYAPTGTAAVTQWSDILLSWCNAAAAALLILLCLIEGRALRVLTGPAPLFLGRVSYSLYLTHVIAPLWVGVITGGLASLAIAPLFWRFVEQPSGRIGHWLAARVAAARPLRRSGA